MSQIRKLKDQARKNAARQPLEFKAVLGRAAGAVKADAENVYVTLYNGDVITVYNERVPRVPYRKIIVGYDERDPHLLQVLRFDNVYNSRPHPNLPNHKDSHKWYGYDPVEIYDQQIMHLLPRAGTGLVVRVHGGDYFCNGTDCILKNMDVDMTDEIPLTGAEWVNVEADENGAITFTHGANKASREMLLPTDRPARSAFRKLLYSAKIYAGQTQFIQTSKDTDIFDPRFTGYASGGEATSIEWANILNSEDNVKAIVNQLGLAGDSFRFAVGGRLVPVENIDSPLVVSQSVSIMAWRIHVRETGTAGTTILDINKNGVSVFADPDDRPTIAFDATGKVIALADTTSYAPGDEISLDIDESATGAEDFSVVGSSLTPVVVTADSYQYKLVGAADPIYTYTSSIAGLEFTGSLSRESGETVGVYEITQGTLTPPQGYLIIFESSDFGIADSVSRVAATAIDYYSSWYPSKLIDGSDATYWGSYTHKPGGVWCKVELDAVKTLASIRLNQFTSVHGATQFKIETSDDDSTWTTRYTSAVSSPVGTTTIVLPFVSAKYIKATCLGGDGGSGWNVYEIDAKGW